MSMVDFKPGLRRQPNTLYLLSHSLLRSTMAHRGGFATLALNISILLIFCLDSRYVSSTEPSVPWYENLPAVAMDYKVHIDPGKEDCYFQYVNPGATFYVSFQVSSLINYLLIDEVSGMGFTCLIVV